MIEVSLVISGPLNLDTDAITQILDRFPTDIRKPPRNVAKYPESLVHCEWTHKEQLSLEQVGGNFDGALRWLLDLISTREEEVLRFCQSNSARISFHLRPFASNLATPEIVTAIENPELLRKVADLEGSIHFHLDSMDDEYWDEPGFAFQLQHSYEKPGGWDEVKMIGLFRRKKDAEAAIDELILRPGFRDHPREAFHIDKYEFGRVWWREGFGSG